MKFLKWFLIVLGALALLFFFVVGPYMRKQTKKHSPETTKTYTQKGLDLSVNYSSPSKKGRVIFGELVPYDLVWRTGANEPTTLTTGTDILIIDKKLSAGTYSVWAKPGKQHWEVMFNSDIPDWGVTVSSGGRETTRNPEYDVVQVQVPVETLSQPQEHFIIDFEDSGQLKLIFSWDTTKVSIPINQ
ncbi:DUF2911 domain-containing protein [Flavobacteriaceae bacterium 3-367]|uniref:DUF2911 domain-containing protein n=1 Tax=Eudoraea algarum TaxID=3417568 RepID=UPI00327E9DC9